MRPLFALMLALAFAACFPPDLGDGMVGCGAAGECPPSYSCHADRRCWKASEGATADLATSGSSDLAGLDLAGADLGSSDMARCASALVCGNKNCGTTPDGCGGIMSCGNACTTGQQCGGGGNANVCGFGVCMPKTCRADKDCGIISDGCAATLDCGGCKPGKSCGGGGPSLCG
ncbi:MAG: Tryptophan synthase alpha chain [Myxococcales bacterium]|nr:Tryptophan synthase alpha chain [Myxococcales bacterium]